MFAKSPIYRALIVGLALLLLLAALPAVAQSAQLARPQIENLQFLGYGGINEQYRAGMWNFQWDTAPNERKIQVEVKRAFGCCIMWVRTGFDSWRKSNGKTRVRVYSHDWHQLEIHIRISNRAGQWSPWQAMTVNR
ncbi:MAG: hypothetical protein OXE95_04470 [Chloroflexi bacterium]|nr:hypothetical protein [Chloroflexota bacterium]MCY4246818.1 hypothetical protein [Chloroflexota bacterium]